MKKRKAPKLPRFLAPKDMKSRIFKSKKEKQASRQFLKKSVESQLD